MQAGLERELVTKRFRLKALESLFLPVIIFGLLAIASVLYRQWAARHGVSLDPTLAVWISLLPVCLMVALAFCGVAVASSPMIDLALPRRRPRPSRLPDQAMPESVNVFERPPRPSAPAGR